MGKYVNISLIISFFQSQYTGHPAFAVSYLIRSIHLSAHAYGRDRIAGPVVNADVRNPLRYLLMNAVASRT